MTNLERFAREWHAMRYPSAYTGMTLSGDDYSHMMNRARDERIFMEAFGAAIELAAQAAEECDLGYGSGTAVRDILRKPLE